MIILRKIIFRGIIFGLLTQLWFDYLVHWWFRVYIVGDNFLF